MFNEIIVLVRLKANEKAGGHVGFANTLGRVGREGKGKREVCRKRAPAVTSDFIVAATKTAEVSHEAREGGKLNLRQGGDRTGRVERRVQGPPSEEGV